MADNLQSTCRCKRCVIAGLMGPVMVITVGVLFLIDRLARAANGSYEIVNGVVRVPLHFHQTWPVLVIVVGVMMLLGHEASTAGHVTRSMGVDRG